MLRLVAGTYGVQPRRVEHAGELAAAVGVGRGTRRRGPRRPSRSRRNGAGADARHVDREHADRRGGRASASRPVSRRGDRPAVPAGLSRVKVTGRVGRHRVADHHHLGGVEHARRARARAGSGRRSSSEALSAPSEPRGAAAGEARTARPEAGPRAPSWPVGRAPGGVAGWEHGRQPLRVALVQEASGLDPEANRGPARRAGARRRGPGRAARGVRPRLRRGRLRRQRVRRAAGRRRSPTELAGWPRARARPWWPACSRPAPDPARPYNTLVVRGAAQAATARSTSTTPSATASPTGSRPARSSRSWSTSAGFAVGLMTCYDLRFPELARRAGRPPAPRCWWCRRPGSPVPARSTTGDAAARPGDREHRVRRRRRPAGPRYTGHSLVVDPLGDVLAEAGDGRGASPRPRPRGVDRGPPYQPVAGQPASVTFTAVSKPCPALPLADGRSAALAGGRGPARSAFARAPGRSAVWSPGWLVVLAAAAALVAALLGSPATGSRSRRRGGRYGVRLGAGGAHRRPAGRLRRRSRSRSAWPWWSATSRLRTGAAVV